MIRPRLAAWILLTVCAAVIIVGTLAVHGEIPA